MTSPESEVFGGGVDTDIETAFGMSLNAETEVDTESDRRQLAELRARLAADAERDGILDVAYTRLDSPVGSLLLAATAAGVVRLAFERQDHDRVLADLATLVSPRVLHAPRRLDGAARQLDEYFAGRRPGVDVALDWQLTAGFRRRVLAHLTSIPYGSTESYAQVAGAAGAARAVRAVGTACARNPFPLLVPCHRVVRSDGSVGQYAGGAQAKALLLELESATSRT